LVDITVLVEGIPDFCRAARSEAGFFTIFHHGELRKLSLAYITDSDTVLPVFVLKRRCEGRIGLVRDDRELCSPSILNSGAILIDWQAQTTSDGLTALSFGRHVAQRTDLEHIRVVPTFAKGGVRE